MSITVNLDEAVAYLRELLSMNKEELNREAEYCPNSHDRMKKSEIMVFAFERKFNSKAKPPVTRTGTPLNIKFGENR